MGASGKREREGGREGDCDKRGSTRCLLTFIAVWWKCEGCRGRVTRAGAVTALSLGNYLPVAVKRSKSAAQRLKAPMQSGHPLSCLRCTGVGNLFVSGAQTHQRMQTPLQASPCAYGHLKPNKLLPPLQTPLQQLCIHRHRRSECMVFTERQAPWSWLSTQQSDRIILWELYGNNIRLPKHYSMAGGQPSDKWYSPLAQRTAGYSFPPSSNNNHLWYNNQSSFKLALRCLSYTHAHKQAWRRQANTQ